MTQILVTSSLCVLMVLAVCVLYVSSWSIDRRDVDEDSFVILSEGNDSTPENAESTSRGAECGGEITLVANSQSTLQYPYSGLYADNVNCQWTIEAPAGMVVELIVRRLSIERSRGCGRDRLELFDISASDVVSSLSGRLCGYRRSLDAVYTTVHQMALIRFLTDDTVGDTGFELQYRPVAMVSDVTSQQQQQDGAASHRNSVNDDRIVIDSGARFAAAAVADASDDYDDDDDDDELSPDASDYDDIDECRDVVELTGKHGVVRYPQHSAQYANNVRCRWSITVPPGDLIRITIRWLDIESKRNCRFRCCQLDKLDIQSGPMPITLCGTDALSSPVYTRTNKALVVFTSNENTTGRGFELYYDRIERAGPSAKLCSADVIELPRSDIGVIQSPGFNQSSVRRYPNGVICQWRITVSHGKKVHLSFDEFFLEDSDNCTADSLSVFDGPDMTSQLLGRFCGGLIPEDLTSSGHQVVVYLLSDLSVSSGGFQLDWTSTSSHDNHHQCASTGCDGTVAQLDVDVEVEKTLHSPNYGTGDNYPSDSWCQWLITSPTDTNVFLRFERFEVELAYSGRTCFDAVTIYDGQDDEAFIIGTYCGHELPPDVLASGNQLLVTFQSDGSSEAPGFLAHYSAKHGSGDIDGRDCGVPDVQPAVYNRIVGGDVANAHSWPWQVSLQLRERGWQHWCGGSVLDKHWIITAAHCLYEFGSEVDFRVVVGEHNRAVDEGTERVMTVSHVIIHENYNRSTTDNDIALLRLSRDVRFSRYIKPICLPRNDVDENTMCLTTGWGDTRGTGNSSLLNQLHLPVLSRTVCNQPGWYSGRLTGNMMCAGYPEGRRDSCQGDSGGPLVCLDDGRWRLYGLTSWGENCASSNKPGIYTRVVNYLDWIEQHTTVTP